MRLDERMPVWDFHERHQVEIPSSPERIHAALHQVDFNRSPVIRSLFALRGVGQLFRRSERRRITVATITSGGFFVLDQDPPFELVVGLVGQFWKLSGNIATIRPEEFLSFDRAGFAKVAWNFHIKELQGGSSMVSTETRIRCLDETSRRKFSRYWRIVRPFSGWTRREMLRLVKRETLANGEGFRMRGNDTL